MSWDDLLNLAAGAPKEQGREQAATSSLQPAALQQTTGNPQSAAQPAAKSGQSKWWECVLKDVEGECDRGALGWDEGGHWTTSPGPRDPNRTHDGGVRQLELGGWWEACPTLPKYRDNSEYLCNVRKSVDPSEMT